MNENVELKKLELLKYLSKRATKGISGEEGWVVPTHRPPPRLHSCEQQQLLLESVVWDLLKRRLRLPYTPLNNTKAIDSNNSKQ